MTLPLTEELARRRNQLADAIRRSTGQRPAGDAKAAEPATTTEPATTATAATAAASVVRPLTDPAGRIDRTAVAFNVFTRLLATDGVRAALYSLLRLTDYRFISIFRFQGGSATSAVHVDRQDLTVRQAAEVADTSTYCCYVRDGNGAFVTADALSDPRTAAHPAREAIRSYCGIPILDPQGALIGTLCHYDTEPRDPAQLDLELLLQAAHALSAPGAVPPYPSAG